MTEFLQQNCVLMCVCVFVSVYSCAFEKQQSELVKDFKLKVLTTSFLITSHLWIYKYTGFLLVWEDFGRMFDNSFPACDFLLFFLFFFFFKVEINSRTLLQLFRPGSVHSGSARWDGCDRVFPDELRVSSFPDRFHTMPGQQHSRPTPTSLGQKSMCV